MNKVTCMRFCVNWIKTGYYLQKNNFRCVEGGLGQGLANIFFVKGQRVNILFRLCRPRNYLNLQF